MAILTWMTVLKTNIAAISSIKQAHLYDDLPGAIAAWPSAIILPISGDQDYSMGGPNLGLYDVRITVYVNKNPILAEGYAKAVPIITDMRDKLASDITLGGTVSHCLPHPDMKFFEGPGALYYADSLQLGINFNIQVKLLESVTVSA